MERSLTTVDRAIAEASAALDQDPGNVFLSLHLARERQRKLALLRQVQNLAERSSTGTTGATGTTGPWNELTLAILFCCGSWMTERAKASSA